MHLRELAVAAALVACLALAPSAACAATIYLDENFDNDTVGALPAGATFLQTGGASLAEVVDDSSSPADPFGPAGNRSLVLRDRYRTSSASDVRTGFKGTLPDAGLTTGTISYEFYGLDAVGDTNPVLSIRAGLNNDVTGATRVENAESAFLLTFNRSNNQIVIIENPSAARTLEQTWSTNAVNRVEIEFDTAVSQWSATLNGVQLTKAGGESTFAFWNNVSGVNQFDLVGGSGTNDLATVFFDNVQIVGPAVPEPGAWSLLGLAGLSLVAPRFVGRQPTRQ